jgi:hypothetical protein
MREVPSPNASEAATLAACVATVLELPFEDVPRAPPGEDVAGWRIQRWLGGRGLGLVPVQDAASFSWAGPWIAWARTASGERRAVVMYGVPSGVVWDPTRGDPEDPTIEGGFVIAAQDIALAPPSLPDAPQSVGTIEAIYVAASAGEAAEALQSARTLAGQGIEGDRHVAGTGTFPSGLPGSALTLIEAEVCESFDPPLGADEHRRNVVTRGIDLNALVGHDFVVGDVRCRGMRLCEPCTVVDRYATRPVLRALVHRGGLRADILDDGVIGVGDRIRAT